MLKPVIKNTLIVKKNLVYYEGNFISELHDPNIIQIKTAKVNIPLESFWNIYV